MVIAVRIIISVIFWINIAIFGEVNDKGPTLTPVSLLIIVWVDKANGPITGGVRGLNTAIAVTIIVNLIIQQFVKKKLR